MSSTWNQRCQFVVLGLGQFFIWYIFIRRCLKTKITWVRWKIHSCLKCESKCSQMLRTSSRIILFSIILVKPFISHSIYFKITPPISLFNIITFQSSAIFPDSLILNEQPWLGRLLFLYLIPNSIHVLVRLTWNEDFKTILLLTRC